MLKIEESLTTSIKYTIFATSWGYFGVAATESGICRASLPVESKERAKTLLCADFGACHEDKSWFSALRTQIDDYFTGKTVDFTAHALDLSYLSEFCQDVLKACAKVPAGSVVTYSELARQLGKSGAGRAVGGALARNPVPLLIPCHRVIRSDGTMGGFSAEGGIVTKIRLLQLEQDTHRSFKKEARVLERL